jgi:hypothetical protein
MQRRTGERGEPAASKAVALKESSEAKTVPTAGSLEVLVDIVVAVVRGL